MTTSPGPAGTSPGPAGTSHAGGRLVDGVLFDVDDTLLDSDRSFVRALAEVVSEYLPHLPPDRHEEVVTVWRADVGGHYRRYTRGEVGYLEQRMARANDLHAQFGGAELDDAALERWNALFERGFMRAWDAYPDAAGVLEHLLAAGVAVGALTNAGVAHQTEKLGASGLDVRVLVGVDTLGVGKPDARVFLEACRRLGTSPARTAYVGDELDVDAVAAREAGLVGVWLDRPGPRRVPVTEADVAAAGVDVIGSLDELPAVLGL